MSGRERSYADNSVQEWTWLQRKMPATAPGMSAEIISIAGCILKSQPAIFPEAWITNVARSTAVYGLLVLIKVKEVRLGAYPLILLFQRELSRDGSWR